MTKNKRQKIKEMFGSRCAYCGCELGEKWHVDHVEPVKRIGTWYRKINGDYQYRHSGQMERPENHREDNLFPACAPCNLHKHDFTLEQFRKLLEGHIAYMNKSSTYSYYRHAKRFGLIQEAPRKIVFYFEEVDKDVYEK